MICSNVCLQLESTDNKVLGTILGNVDEIIFGCDVGTELDSFDESFDGSNDNNLQGSFLEDLLRSIDVKVHGNEKCINIGLFDGKLLHTILGDLDGITLVFDVGTDLGYLDGPFDGLNGAITNCLLLGDSLGYTDGKVLGYNEGIELGYNNGKFLDTVLGNVDGIILGIDVGT